MSAAEKFNNYSTVKIPRKFGRKFPDLMMVMDSSQASDGAGGTVYADRVSQSANPIPCFYSPNQSQEDKKLEGARIGAKVEYSILFPNFHDGVRVSVQSNDRLKILARGQEPEKIFKIVGVKDQSGLFFEAIAERE